MSSQPERFLRYLTGAETGVGTHAHVIGSSGAGKSRYLESLIRTALYDTPGFCLIDWHGPVYEGVLDYLSCYQPDHKKIYLLDPANGDFITPYNPFRPGAKNPVSAANSYIEALSKVWGAKDTTSTPRIEQIAKLLFLVCVLSGESLSNVSAMLRQDRVDVRRWSWRVLSEHGLEFMRDEMADLAEIDPKKWNEHVSSTIRRLGRLISDPAVFRFFNLGESLNLREIMDEGSVLLVNLAQVGNLDRQSAKSFASLLMADFMTTAMRRSVKDDPDPFILFMDEFHEYLTPDTTSILEGARKGGLHLVMAHQQLDQLDRVEEQGIRASILQNAGIKVCFRQNDVESAKFMVDQLFLHELNQNWVKDEVFRWETIGHALEQHPTQAWSYTKSTNAGRNVSHYDGEETLRSSESEGTGDSLTGTFGTALLLRPILQHNPSSRTFYTIEEKRLIIAQRLTDLEDRQYFVRYSRQIPEVQFTDEIRRHRFVPPDVRADYLSDLLDDSRALPPSEADLRIRNSSDVFKQRIAPPKKPKKTKSSPAPVEEDDVVPNTKRPT